MRRALIGAIGLCVASGWAASGQDTGPPPLAPPAELPPPASATTAPLDLAPTPLAPEERPLLVVPGLPTPRVRGTTSSLADLPAITPALPTEEAPIDEGPPPLIGPADLGEAVPRGIGAPRFLPDLPPGSSPPPLTLEPADEGPAPRLRPLEPGPTRDELGATGRNRIPSPPPSTPPPPRRRLFGLFQRPGTTNAVPPPSARLDDSKALDEPEERDPDAELQRRLETQIRNALGARVRSLDVQVKGRRVSVQAAPSRFWYKRGVRRTLETLPALAGFQTRIDVVD